MAKTIYSIIPNPEDLLAMEPEEIAGIVLEHLNAAYPGEVNLQTFSSVTTVKEYPPEYRDILLRALMEAWVWLEREGLVVQKPWEMGKWFFISRRGYRMRQASDLEAYRKANLLPKDSLHPVIKAKVWGIFLKGDYDTAIFQAFKEVEVAVRQAAGLGDDLDGPDLMLKAFQPPDGPLADRNTSPELQEATLDLFASSISLYRNPLRQENITVTNSTHAAEIIVMASHLMRIIDSRLERGKGKERQEKKR